MKLAIMREVSPSIAQCELTHLDRESIDLERAREEHASYHALLTELGWTVRVLPADPDFPDSVFVEDTAVILGDVAVLCRPGAVSRRGEVTSIRECLEPHCRIIEIEEPHTVDGGDVLVLGSRVWVGVSSRTQRGAVEQLSQALSPLGFVVTGVTPKGCLHLKSAVTAAGENHLIVNPSWISTEAFDGFEIIEVNPSEPQAANVLRVDDVVVVPESCPRTRVRIEERGLSTRSLSAAELAKAEGALTCCSLLLAV